MKRRVWLLRIAIVVLPLIGAFVYASVDRCGVWPSKPAELTQLARGQGLEVGVARVEMKFNFPLTVGGYGPIRSTAEKQDTLFAARALVFDAGGQKLGLVLFDALLIPPQLRDAVGKDIGFPVWVIATHTHTGASGYDRRFASEVGGLGTFSEKDEAVFVTAGREALAAAQKKMTRVTVSTGEHSTEGVSVPRSGEDVDQRVTVISFSTEEELRAMIIIASAHPTLVERRPTSLHGDWPARLAERFEKDNGPITFVLQGAAGNASVDRAKLSTPEAMASAMETAVQNIALTPVDSPDVGFDEVQISLPRPEARGLVPGTLQPAVENALCDDMEDIAAMHALRLGSMRLLFVPVEPSFKAGLILESQARANRVVSLADGYAGYLETVAAHREMSGESHRQYFSDELITRMVEGAKLAGDAIGK